MKVYFMVIAALEEDETNYTTQLYRRENQS